MSYPSSAVGFRPAGFLPYVATSIDHPFGERKASAVMRKLLEIDSSHGHHPLDVQHRAITQSIGEVLAPELPLAPDIFEESGIEIVPDNTEDPTLTQICASEAHYFNALFQSIEKDETSFHFSSPFFKDKMIQLLKSLATRPSGRILIHNLAACKFPVHFAQGESCFRFDPRSRSLQIALDVDHLYYCISQGAGGPLICDTPHDIVLAHEMVHALHFLWRHKLYFLEGEHVLDMFDCKSLIPSIPDLEEQMTIFGIPQERMVCENCVRKEFGYPPRIDYHSSYFPPFSRLYADRIHTERVGTYDYNRIESAARFGLKSEVYKLLAWGANPSEGMALAALNGHAEVLSALADAGGDVECIGDSGNSLLHRIALRGNSACIKVLVKHGANLKRQDSLGRTPLHIAAFRGNLAACRVLLDHGASVETKDDQKMTPLAKAVYRGKPRVIQLLLEHGAHVDRSTLNALMALKKRSSSTKEQKRNLHVIEKILLPHLDHPTVARYFLEYPIKRKKFVKF